MPYVKYFLTQTGQNICSDLCCNNSSPLSSRLLLGNPHMSNSLEKQLQDFQERVLCNGLVFHCLEMKRQEQCSRKKRYKSQPYLLLFMFFLNKMEVKIQLAALVTDLSCLRFEFPRKTLCSQVLLLFLAIFQPCPKRWKMRLLLMSHIDDKQNG